MSLFLQYQLGQALGDLGAGGDAGGACAGAATDAAASGFGFGMGFLMPALFARALPPATWAYAPRAIGPHGFIGQHRYCGHCGAGLVPGGRFCGCCGTATGR